MELLLQYLQCNSQGRVAEEKESSEALSTSLQQLIRDSIHNEYREAPSAQELMCTVLQVMRLLVHEVQVCCAVGGASVTDDDVTHDPTGKATGEEGNEWDSEVLSVVEKKLGEVLLCLKLLRNLCAGVEKNQDVVSKEDLLSLKVFLLQLKESHIQLASKSTATLVCRTALQFLGNVCVLNRGKQRLVWKIYFSEVFVELLSKWPPAVADVACMVLHTCVYDDQERRIELANHGTLLAAILILINEAPSQENNLEWAPILVSLLLKKRCLLNIFALECAVLSTMCRAVLMEFLLDELNIQSHDKERPTQTSHVAIETEWLQEEDIAAVVREFCSCQPVLEAALPALRQASTTGKCDDEEIRVKLELLKKLLSLLCTLSSGESHSAQLQQQEGLLPGAVGVLALLSKADGTIGSAKNTSQLRLSQPSGAEPLHPLFGVKRDLIRLVGNLCYRSQHNQSVLNDLEGIQLVLNHCSIDHYNPYIAQWSIWAIRNFCQDNLQNQQVVASIEHRKGGISSQVLEECGLQVEVGPDGHLRVCQKQGTQGTSDS